MKCQNLFLITLLISWFSLGAEQKPKMIVFIHGTIKPVEFTFSNLFKIMRNKIENSVYMKTAKEIRKDPFFFQGQPMQHLGLHPINEQSPSTAAICFTHLFDKQYNYLYKDAAPRLYYTFGWSGLMSKRKRYEAAQKLYKALTEEVKKLNDQGIHPEIELYCYSYGGNVALNLAAVRDDDPTLDPHAFVIDQLVLYGVPVQQSTDYLVSNPIFKKVYHFYSKEDAIQTMDIFSSQEFFIKNRFSHRSTFKIPQKVIQVRIRCTKNLRGLNKINYNPNESYKLLASTKLRKKHTEPGHTELWNFIWGAYWYRDYFALNPLPVASLTPSFIHALENHAPAKNHITLDYCKNHYGALLTGHLKHLRKAVPILTPELTEEIIKTAHTFEPEDFSVETQKIKIKNILKNIRKNMKKTNPLRKSKLLTHYSQSKLLPQVKKIRHSHLLSAKL